MVHKGFERKMDVSCVLLLLVKPKWDSIVIQKNRGDRYCNDFQDALSWRISTTDNSASYLPPYLYSL